MSQKTALYTLGSIFFFFGFVAASNSILIPTFKNYFSLSQSVAQLVDFAFYIAYFVGSAFFLLYARFRGDFINQIGYKNGLILGLGISALGALMFVPASWSASFPLFLVALFLIAFGFSLQQIVLNPFLISLGTPETGAHRINLAGSINSFGTTIAPIILSYILFHSVQNKESIKDLHALIKPAFILFGLFLLAIIVVFKSALPDHKKEHLVDDFQLSKYPELVLGILAIFIYVGVEVTLGSNLGEYLKQTKGLPESQISMWVSLYWGSLMIGRWSGATEVFFAKNALLKWVKFLAPFVAFALLMMVNWIYKNDVTQILPYSILVFMASLIYIFSGKKASNNLFVMGVMGLATQLFGVILGGEWGLLLIISGGLWCSVMWPCIFEIATKRLGKYTNQGSSLLVMMIIGGAVVPIVQGMIADRYGIATSYFVGVFCFAYLAFYGFYAIRKQL
jgi:FHS family L-fucose permease-like MFS transporter